MHPPWITDNRIHYAVNGNYPLAVHYRVNDKVIYRSLQSKRVVHYTVNGKGQIMEGWRPGSLVKITINNQICLMTFVDIGLLRFVKVHGLKSKRNERSKAQQCCETQAPRLARMTNLKKAGKGQSAC